MMIRVRSVIGRFSAPVGRASVNPRFQPCSGSRPRPNRAPAGAPQAHQPPGHQVESRQPSPRSAAIRRRSVRQCVRDPAEKQRADAHPDKIVDQQKARRRGRAHVRGTSPVTALTTGPSHARLSAVGMVNRIAAATIEWLEKASKKAAGTA